MVLVTMVTMLTAVEANSRFPTFNVSPKQQFRLHAIVAWVSHFRAQEHHCPPQRSMQEQVIELLGYLTSYIEKIGNHFSHF